MANLGRSLSLCRRNLFHFTKYSRQCVRFSHPTITGYTSVDKAMNTMSGGKIGGWLQTYENMVGLTEVRSAQSNVIEAENLFLQVQAERRRLQNGIASIHSKLKDIHAQLDKVQRGDERYLNLLTEEYQIIREEKQIETELSIYETKERDQFAALSSAVRESHEKERARTERTKYWSIIGSIIGATIGILGTSINNYLRMRELRGIVKDSAQGGIELKGIVATLSETMHKQHDQVQTFVQDLKVLTGTARSSTKDTLPIATQAITPTSSSDQIAVQTKQILDLVQTQDEALSKEMSEIKRILASSKAADQENNIVYVGPEMESLLEKAENNIEWKIKTNALWTITLIYGAFALTLPVLYSIFKGGS